MFATANNFVLRYPHMSKKTSCNSMIHLAVHVSAVHLAGYVSNIWICGVSSSVQH